MATAPDDLSIETLPLSRENAARLWAIAQAPTHIPPALLDAHLCADNPCLAHGDAAIILAGNQAGWVVARDARNPQTAMFSCLTLAASLTPQAKQAVLEQLLTATRAWARALGASRLVGPIFFSTWWPYRVLARDFGHLPWPFPGEYTEAEHRLADYEQMGLTITDRFVSRHLDRRWPPWWALDWLERWLRRNSPITIRALTPDEIRGQASAIFELVSDIFSQNAHYTPLDERAFTQLYLAGLPGNSIVLGAFDKAGALTGFCSGSVHGKVGILKTVGVVAAHRGTRLGMGLTYQFHRELMHHGCNQAVHAMMKDDNASNRLSGRVARVMREYVLVGCAID